MKVSHSFRVDAPLERVAELLCSEAFNVDHDQSRGDVFSARYEALERSAERAVFDMHLVEYGRTLTGKIDQNKRTKSRTHNVWHAPTRTLSWDYHMEEHAGRFSLSGKTRLFADGSGTRLELEAEIEVKIPLVGKQIAKMIGGEIQETQAQQQSIMERHLKE